MSHSHTLLHTTFRLFFSTLNYHHNSDNHTVDHNKYLRDMLDRWAAGYPGSVKDLVELSSSELALVSPVSRRTSFGSTHQWRSDQKSRVRGSWSRTTTSDGWLDWCSRRRDQQVPRLPEFRTLQERSLWPIRHKRRSQGDLMRHVRTNGNPAEIEEVHRRDSSRITHFELNKGRWTNSWLSEKTK